MGNANANAWPRGELGQNIVDLEEFPIQNNLLPLLNKVPSREQWSWPRRKILVERRYRCPVQLQIAYALIDITIFHSSGIHQRAYRTAASFPARSRCNVSTISPLRLDAPISTLYTASSSSPLYKLLHVVDDEGCCITQMIRSASVFCLDALIWDLHRYSSMLAAANCLMV